MPTYELTLKAIGQYRYLLARCDRHDRPLYAGLLEQMKAQLIGLASR